MQMVAQLKRYFPETQRSRNDFNWVLNPFTDVDYTSCGLSNGDTESFIELQQHFKMIHHQVSLPKILLLVQR